MRAVGLRGILLLACAVVLARPAPAAPSADAVAAARAVAQKARAKDADDLRRLARWGDEVGVPRTADADWERAWALDPDDDATRKRLHVLKRGAECVRDEASWALVRTAKDPKPERRTEYAARRLAEVVRPSVERHRAAAAALYAAGLPDEGVAELAHVLALDPADPWARLALGDVLDPGAGWVPADLAARWNADEHAGAVVRRLGAAGVRAERVPGEGPRSAAVGKPLAVWRLREWVLETDHDEETAAATLEAVDLAARWFRARFGVAPAAPVLPGEGRLVLLSSEELYARAVDGETGLSPAVRRFAKGLSAIPVPAEPDRGPWVVLLERPSLEFAADACVHYAMHLLFQARYHVTSDEGWLYEGLAAYATIRLLSTQASWCVRLEETSAATAERAPHAEAWAEQTWTTVGRGRDEPLVRLVGASLNELDGPMLVKAWSFLRFLLEEHAEEGEAFLAAKRLGLKTPQALLAATGLRLEDADAAWRAWVGATLGE